MEKVSTENVLKSLPDSIALTQEQKDSLTWGLFDWLAHGDSKHRMWLFQAIYAYINKNERPSLA